MLLSRKFSTGLKIVRSYYGGNNKTKKTKIETEVYCGLGFIEEVRGSYRDKLIDRYGLQEGTYYLLHSCSCNDIQTEDIAYFNKNEMNQNISYQPNEYTVKAKVLPSVKGAGFILKHDEYILVSFN
jgi:hypothetical protein